MSEEYSLFYRILEGDLSPFLPENTREENFFKYFKDDSVCELNEFLIDNTISVTFITQSYRISKYYYSVIHKECNRLVNVFDQEYASSVDKTAFSNFITKQYERLLLLMKKVRIKQHTFGQEFTARYEKMINLDNKFKKQSTIRDIFYYFNEYLIEFSIHIATHYVSHITVEKYKNRHELYPKLFHEPSPLSNTKNDSIRSYLADTRRFVEKNNFDLKEAKLLLTNVIKVFNNFSNIKSSVSQDEEFNQTFINNIKAIENLIFANTHKIDIGLKSYTVIISESYNSSAFGYFKNFTKEKLTAYNNPVDSLDFINTILRTNDSYKVNDKVPEDVQVNSLPRLAEEWLLLLKDHCLKHPSLEDSSKSQKSDEKALDIITSLANTMGFRGHSNAEIDDYINDWLQSRTTLDQWLNFSDVDLGNILREVPLSEKEQIEIDNHRFELYNQCVENTFKNRFKSKFETIQDINEKITVAKRDLALIEDFIYGNIDSFKASRLETSFGIKEWEHTALQFEHILKHRYISDDNHNIHSPDSYADAEAIIKYKSYLTDFLTKINDADVSSSTKDNKVIKNKSTKILPVAYKYKKYNSNLSAITDMMRFLIKNNFLYDKTDITEFRKIFNNTKPDNPIVWIHGIESLKYFISLLQENTQIFEKVKTRIWIITSSLFVNEYNIPFDRKKFNGQHTPASANLLERAIEFLK